MYDLRQYHFNRGLLYYLLVYSIVIVHRSPLTVDNSEEAARGT